MRLCTLRPAARPLLVLLLLLLLLPVLLLLLLSQQLDTLILLQRMYISVGDLAWLH
jgi:hypothetical protein